jgi:hypothetical protein
MPLEKGAALREKNGTQRIDGGLFMLSQKSDALFILRGFESGVAVRDDDGEVPLDIA